MSPRPPPPPPLPVPDGPRHRVRLLVIDDNPDDIAVLQLAAEELEAAGGAVVAVDGVEDGETALARLTGPRPDIVLLDWGLPGSGPLDVLDALTGDERWADVPVVVYSGSDDPDQASLARARGATRVEVKQAGIDAVTDLLARVARLSRARPGPR